MSDLRFSGDRKLKGGLEQYVNGKWSPICHRGKLGNVTVKKYCQNLGYADGIQTINHTVSGNITRCQLGREVRLRCYLKRM